MHANEVIEMYVDDTVRLLPKRQRVDVAAELRALLNDELNARAAEAGRAADEALALSLVRGFGLPNAVAARYQSPWTIIDPADTRSFLRAAFIGASAVILLSALRGKLPRTPGTADDAVTLVILAWLGLLVGVFGVKSWIYRRWPATAIWKPRDRDRVSRVGTAILVPTAALVILLYAAPVWVFDQLSGGRFDSSWAAYTAEFQQLRLPWFITFLVGTLALRLFAAIQGRWSWLTRRLNIVLNLALAGLTLSFAVNGHIFQSSTVDDIARSVLALVAAIYVPNVGVQIYGELGRIDRTRTTNQRLGSAD
jgi:hypothetical protein